MAVATAMPAVATSDKVAIPAEMAAMESSPVKPSATMASAATGECSWSDRQHAGKDQSDNLNSAHIQIPSEGLSGRFSWNDNRICRFDISLADGYWSVALNAFVTGHCLPVRHANRSSRMELAN
jgi:hypothetical protein